MSLGKSPRSSRGLGFVARTQRVAKNTAAAQLAEKRSNSAR